MLVPGVKKFRKFLSDNDISDGTAAAALGVSRPTIIAWRKATAKPVQVHRTKIKVWTGGAIVEDDWATPEELELRRSVTAVEPFQGAG